MNTYKIISSNAGFSKVTRPDGIIENMLQKKIDILKQDKKIKFVTVKIVEAPVVIVPEEGDIDGEA